MTDILLSVRHLRVVFPHRYGDLVPIDDISVNVQKGEIIGFVGESGAGQSMAGAGSMGLGCDSALTLPQLLPVSVPAGVALINDG